MATATCHTEGCPNADHAIEVDLTFTDEEGTEQTVGSVVCGVCGRQIEDVS